MSKKDRYSHLGGDTDETSDDEEVAVDEVADESNESNEPNEEVIHDPDEGVEDTPNDAGDDGPDEAATDDLDDGAIRVTISSGDDEHEVVIESGEGVTTDDVVHAVQHAGQEETKPKTVWGSWVQMVSSLGKARLAAVTVASVVTVKGLAMLTRRLKRRRD